MVAAADVAKIPVLEMRLLPGKASTMEWAFSFGSTGVDKKRTPMGLRAAKKAGRAALVTILLIKAIIREDGTLRIALVRVFFSTTSGAQFRTMVGRHSAISLEVLDCRNGKGARSKL